MENNNIDVQSDILDIFCHILDNKCILAKGKQHSHANLNENGRDAKLKKLLMVEIKENILILQTDINKNNKEDYKICSLFKKTKYGHNKTCDYVLIRKNEHDNLELYYIDLKSNCLSGFENQFKSTKCFMHYVCNLINTFSNKSIKIIKESFIIFTTLKNKSTTNYIRKQQERGLEICSPRKIAVQNNGKISCSKIFNGYEIQT